MQRYKKDYQCTKYFFVKIIIKYLRANYDDLIPKKTCSILRKDFFMYLCSIANNINNWTYETYFI